MNPKAAIALKLLAPAAGLGLGAATGYHFGMRSGANRTADAMAQAFSEANAVENEGIAEEYYERGLEEGLGMKTASYNAVYSASLIDELEKMGGIPTGLITGAAKAIGSSFKGLAGGVGEAAGHLGAAASLGKGAYGMGAKDAGKALIGAAKANPLATGIVGGAAAAGAAGVANRKQ